MAAIVEAFLFLVRCGIFFFETLEGAFFIFLGPFSHAMLSLYFIHCYIPLFISELF